MAKTVRTLSIDSEVWERFQVRYPGQASDFCQEAMRKRLEIDEGKLDGVNLEILIAEEKKAQKQKDDANARLQKIKEQKDFITSRREEEEEKKLQAEKKRLEGLSACAGCGRQMDKPHIKPEETGGLPFCKECFLSNNPKLEEALKNMRSLQEKPGEKEGLQKHKGADSYEENIL